MSPLVPALLVLAALAGFAAIARARLIRARLASATFRGLLHELAGLDAGLSPVGRRAGGRPLAV